MATVFAECHWRHKGRSSSMAELKFLPAQDLPPLSAKILEGPGIHQAGCPIAVLLQGTSGATSLPMCRQLDGRA